MASARGEGLTFVTSAVACAREHGADGACAYKVAWSINPHMRPGTGDARVAARQASRLAAALENEGARTIELPFVHGAHDSVFTKDAALLLDAPSGRRALLASPRCDERRAEASARARQLATLGFEAVAPPGCAFEGGDVAVLPRDAGLVLGHGPRTARAAAAWLEVHTELPVLPLELIDPHLFHLDMALAVLPDGTALACGAAFAPGALRALARCDGVTSVVDVPREEALAFALNLVAVGDAVIVGGAGRVVEATLRRRGYRAVFVDLREFHLAGGSAACLVARVHADPRGAARGAARGSFVA